MQHQGSSNGNEIDTMSASQTKRRVNPLENANDFEVLLLAEFGMSGAFIGGAARMSRGQVYYREKKAGMKLSDYRNGISEGAKYVLNNDTQVATKIRERLS